MLTRLEALGNKLPDPVVLFATAALCIVALSAFLAGWQVPHPAKPELVTVQDLLAGPNLRRMFTDAVKNFGAFPPLATVLVAIMGIGLADRSGLVSAVLGRAVSAVPPRLLTLALLFVGANGALASDASFVVLVPLGAALWARAGRHPLAGMSIAYAAVSGGYGANLLVTALDPLLAGLTEAAARLVDPEIRVAATCNWFFNAASVLVVTGVGALVAPSVERRFGAWSGEGDLVQDNVSLVPAGIALAATLAVLAVVLRFVLYDGTWTPIYDSIVIIVAIAAGVPGVVHGVATGLIRSSHDAVKLCAEAVSGMGGYLVLAFAAAQFVAWFNWSNLGLVLAVKGAAVIEQSGLGVTALLALFVAVSAVLNLVIASASAKWAFMAPLFVPMLMLVGIPPATTQAAYRVGDAFTNILTPLMPYMPIVLATARRYVPAAGQGTILAAQLPFAVAWGITWTALLLGWNALGWPLGV